MKDKPKWIYSQSGVIPIYKNKVILISTRKSKQWTIPKGIIEKAMLPEISAAKEALEEAGITGEVVPERVGKYKYKKWGGECTVKVYPFRVEKLLDDWEEKEIRKRKVITIEKACSMVKNDDLRMILRACFRQYGNRN